MTPTQPVTKHEPETLQKLLRPPHLEPQRERRKKALASGQYWWAPIVIHGGDDSESVERTSRERRTNLRVPGEIDAAHQRGGIWVTELSPSRRYDVLTFVKKKKKESFVT